MTAADPVVGALDRAAHPLRTVEPVGDTRDLRPRGRMVGDARVVGLGEATHSSYDFFTLRHRVFRHLVEREGFRTSGPRLNSYVVHGLRNTEEYLRLVEWMRAYNARRAACSCTAPCARPWRPWAAVRGTAR